MFIMIENCKITMELFSIYYIEGMTILFNEFINILYIMHHIICQSNGVCLLRVHSKLGHHLTYLRRYGYRK